MQDAGAVPLAVRPTGVVGQVTVRPVAGLTIEVRATVPAKLKVLVSTTDIEPPDAPVLKLTETWEEMVKPPTCTVALAEWDAEPCEPTPVIITLYVPGVVELKEQDAFAVAFTIRLTAAEHETVRAVVGVTAAVRVTLPAKLFTLVNVTGTDGAEAPALKLTEPGEALMAKSPT